MDRRRFYCILNLGRDRSNTDINHHCRITGDGSFGAALEERVSPVYRSSAQLKPAHGNKLITAWFRLCHRPEGRLITQTESRGNCNELRRRFFYLAG